MGVQGHASLYNKHSFGIEALPMTAKRLIFLAFAGIAALVAGFFMDAMLPRPPAAAAKLMRPILKARMRWDDSDYSPGSAGRQMEDGLQQIANDPSPAADVASVILLDYSLGAHNAETQLCSVTRRGPRILPMLRQYREHPVGVLRLQYQLFKLNGRERNSMYDEATESIQRGEIVGCE